MKTLGHLARQSVQSFQRGSHLEFLVPWERKVFFDWSRTQPVRLQWANHLTRRLEGIWAARALLDPRYCRNTRHRQNKKRLFGEGLGVDKLALPSLACNKWFHFAYGGCQNTPPFSTSVYCNVRFSLVLFVPLEEVLRLKPFKLRVGVVSVNFSSCRHFFYETAEVRGEEFGHKCWTTRDCTGKYAFTSKRRKFPRLGGHR